MSTATKDRTERLAEHRATIERARETLYDAPSVDKVFDLSQGAADALKELANVSLELWSLGVTAELPSVKAGPNQLDYGKVCQIAPMRKNVAHAVLEHVRAVDKIRERLRSHAIERENVIQDFTRALAGYGPDVGSPVLEAAKTLDLSGEEEG